MSKPRKDVRCTYKRVMDNVQEFLQTLSEDELELLKAGPREFTQVNCGWDEYGFGQILGSYANWEIERRAEQHPKTKDEV